MKYFLHDSSAFDDEKITELFINFGYEGLGLFYTILEKLAKQEKPIKTDVLKHQLKVGKKLEKCWKFMESLDIISSNNDETFNKQLLNFSEKYKIKSEKNAKRISQWRDNQNNIENVTRYEHVCNTPKVKESKVKESKVNNIEPRLFNFKEDLVIYGFSENLVEEWIKIRKVKKLTFTETIAKKFKIEVEKVLLKYPTSTKDMILEKIIFKGWGGFDAKWIDNEVEKAKQNNNQPLSHKNEGSNMKYGYEWLNNGK